jgi:hypothetical protein
MSLVYEDEFGSYLGVRPDFLKKFVPVEINPNFEVYDSKDGCSRFIAVKSSRVPDDEDIDDGRLCIDFNRAKPTLQQALEYGAELPGGYKWLGNLAFASKNIKEYALKSGAWDKFYSFIWDSKPQTLWVAPHSGNVTRPPDDIISFPKLMIDNNTAGIAASCAFNNNKKGTKRIMMAVHSTGQLGAVLNLGDFGVADREKMDNAAVTIEKKYHSRAQLLAGDFIRDFCEKSLQILESIGNIRGTIKPEQLARVSYDDSFTVATYVKCLKRYGLEIKKFTFKEFTVALQKLTATEVPVILNNFIYPARSVGKMLALSDKIAQGQMYSALNIECARVYSAKDPELVAEIILDVKNELFGCE